MRSLPICEPGALLFLRVAAMQGVTPAWLYSKEPRTEPSGLPPDDPAVKHGDISISAGDATCQQKADGKMKGIQKERLSDSLKFIRVTEGGRTPMRGVLLWGFLSNFNLHSTLNSSSVSLSLCVCPVVCLSLSLCLPVSGRISPVCLPVCFHARLSATGCQFAALSAHHLFYWICSLTPDSSAHRWCGHLLWDPGRWQGAQSLPEGQGAAGDQAPQSHGEG